MSTSFDITGLRRLYAENPIARAFLDHSANRRYNQAESKVDRVMQILGQNGNEVPRSDIVAMFRALEQYQCGQFIIGRRGWPSRFVWSVGMISVGRAATGEISEIETLAQEPGEDVAAATEALVHSFHLRPQWEVNLELPSDLTTNEAHRLADFIKSLPFEADE